jgi:hypothetical protein
MGVEEFNLMAFGINRAHFNKQPDLHISGKLPRFGANGGVVENPPPNFMCACVACEVFDAKHPGKRIKTNNERPDEHTSGGAKRVVAPTRYLSGSEFAAPNHDIEGLLKIFKGADFRVDLPPQPRTAAQTAQATDAGQCRATATRKDRLQNERDRAGLAQLQSDWNAVPDLRSDDEARDLLGVPNPGAARGAGRQAQYGATFEQALQPENTRQPARKGAIPATLYLPPSPAIDSPAARAPFF